MSHSQRTLDYLWSLAPEGASNTAIAGHLGTTHQTAFMLTRDLMGKGLIRGEQQGRTWIFYAVDGLAEPEQVANGYAVPTASATLSPISFETLARRVLSQHYILLSG
jgi:hypothetical protein